MHYLPRHVFCCERRDGIVFLNLLTNRYLHLSKPEADILRSSVSGFPDRPHSGSRIPVDAMLVDSLMDSLATHGLLTQDPAIRRTGPQPGIAPPTSSLPDLDIERVLITGKHVAYALAATTLAIVQLRLLPLSQIVSRVIRRRRVSVTAAAPLTGNALVPLLAAFTTIRQFIYTAADACLFDSLATLHYLAHWNSYPNWIFGVRTQPFSAHCWVQQGGVVINESVHRILSFTPIMVV